MKLLFSYIIFLVACIGAKKGTAASVKGSITDEKNQPLSFVTVYARGTNIGTSCNDEGNYELKLDAGSYEIVFQYIGYKLRVERVDLKDGETIMLNVSLSPENFSLNEISVRATAEDPAYPIMRQAMAMRKLYLFEPKEFTCNVYIKGMQRVTTIPKRVLLIKVPVEIKKGIIYLSESLSELSYQAPNKIKERMISSKVSGDNKAFSFNRAGGVKFNLYENVINAFGLSERGFISPLASNAFLYYRYKLEGESRDNGQTIYKIKLIPIRDNDPVFRGDIYIIKDSWRLHSTDLLVNKSSGVEFVDTLYIKETYAQQEGGMWMPVSQRFIFQLEVFGFKGNGYFVAIYSKYKVNSLYPPSFYGREKQALAANEKVPEVRKVARKKAERKKTDSSLFAKKYFSNEVMVIDKKANTADDSLWAAIRPVPLSAEEVQDYHHKDSVKAIEESKPYLDSIDRINNRPDLTNIFITGYSFNNTFRKTSFSMSPPFTIIQYNTVEGLVLNPRMSIRKDYEDNRYFEITPNLRYGFASQRFYARLNAAYQSDPVRGTLWSAGGGSFVEQFNSQNPITPAINTVYTLLAERNYLKLYQKDYGTVAFQSTVINGLNLRLGAEYAHRSALANSTDYTFNDMRSRNFTSNDPFNKETAVTAFSTHSALLLNAVMTIRFKQRYITRPDMRITFRTRYPTITVNYTKGIKAMGSNVDFDRLSLGVNHRWDLKLWGKSFVEVKGGGFLRAANLYFMDYQHFNGNRTILTASFNQGFQLLDYYAYSTRRSFAEGHFNHHFNGFLLNKIPLIRKLKWQEVVTFNYLKTPTSPTYFEIGAGIEHILKVVRIDFFTSFENGGQVRQGIVAGYGF